MANLNPEEKMMADESMVRNLAAQAEAIWPQELPLLRRYALDDMAPGDAFVVNHPYLGGSPHASDMAIITPIFQTSTYVQDELGKHKGFEYARTQNPTRAALEANLAAIEAGVAGFAFASGMSAVGAIAARLSSGDHVIVTDNMFGDIITDLAAMIQGGLGGAAFFTE